MVLKLLTFQAMASDMWLCTKIKHDVQVHKIECTLMYDTTYILTMKNADWNVSDRG